MRLQIGQCILLLTIPRVSHIDAFALFSSSLFLILWVHIYLLFCCRPQLPLRHVLNAALLVASVVAGCYLCAGATDASVGTAGAAAYLWAILLIALAMGAHLVMSIGGMAFRVFRSAFFGYNTILNCVLTFIIPHVSFIITSQLRIGVFEQCQKFLIVFRF